MIEIRLTGGARGRGVEVKIGIYNQPLEGAIGGSEYCAAVLSEALSRSHDVEVIHHRAGLRKEGLGEFFAVDLSGIRLRYVPYKPYHYGHSRTPWRRVREARSWQSDLSEPYDVFVNFTHDIPPFCRAPNGVLVVLFPAIDVHQMWPWNVVGTDCSWLWRRMRVAYSDWEWKKRFASYSTKTAISRFSRDWARRWWEVDCEVVYPPVTGCGPVVEPKTNSILSVGRFTTSGHTKKQREMLVAFGSLKAAQSRGWQYHCIGGLSDVCEDQEYFHEVSHLATASGARITANIEHRDLRRAYAQAKIFWHATGYGEDDSHHPERQEHFGITTAEAMSAGCVPVVFNMGAQPEIVEHGASGFVWNTLEELQHYTMLLVRDGALHAKMSEAARQRAQIFSRESFVKRFLNLL